MFILVISRVFISSYFDFPCFILSETFTAGEESMHKIHVLPLSGLRVLSIELITNTYDYSIEN